MMASLKFVGASPKILTFWKNTDQLQTIFNYFSEKVCITDQNYLYRPNCHHCYPGIKLNKVATSWGWLTKGCPKFHSFHFDFCHFEHGFPLTSIDRKWNNDFLYMLVSGYPFQNFHRAPIEGKIMKMRKRSCVAQFRPKLKILSIISITFKSWRYKVTLLFCFE